MMVPKVMDTNGKTNEAKASTSAPSTSSQFVTDDYISRVLEVFSLDGAQLTPEARFTVGSNVDYYLKHLVRGAHQIAMHSRRLRVIPDDVDAVIQQARQEPIYGIKQKEFLPLRLTGAGAREIFYEEDKELELNPIYTLPASRIPPHTDIRAHWLAIDGEQPAVPENPVPPQDEKSSKFMDSVNGVDEAQEEANRLISIVKGHTKETVNVKTMTTHTLSLEQQVYYKEIMDAIMGNEEAKRTEALHSLKTDTGLQPLMGRFALAISEGVKCNIVQHNLVLLIYLMRMLQSIVHNHNVSLDKYLHQLLPSVMSCILSKQLCSKPDTDIYHWSLREYSSSLLADMCRKNHALDVQSRVTQVLTKVWADDTCALSTLYGTLYALNEFGQETMVAVVIPRVSFIYDRFQRLCSTSQGDRTAQDKITNFLTKVLTNYVRSQHPAHLVTYQDFATAFGGFGEAVYRTVAPELQNRPKTTTTSQPRIINRPPNANSSSSTSARRVP